MLKATQICLAITAGLVVSATSLGASPIRLGFDSVDLGATDDGSSGPVGIGFDVNFFDDTSIYSDLYVNNNGNVTFGQSLGQYSPSPIDQLARPIIAPFFADVDTANNGIGETVTYGQGSVDGRAAFGVNWLDVNYYNNFAYEDRLNSFQLILIDRADTGAGNFDIEFNYGSILWEAGVASGGNLEGLGGNTARAGFSAGTGAGGSYIELDGSATAGAFLDGGTNALAAGSNVGFDGRYLFTIRDGQIEVNEDPNLIPNPLPSGLPLLLGGMGILAYLRRKSAAK